MKYDFIIIGAGLYGCTFAYLAKQHGKRCLIVDKRDHIGGNCYTENRRGIYIHKYGPHIFNTNDKKIWEFINSFGEFNNFVNKPKVVHKNNIYSFPINLMTLHQLWGVGTPKEAREKIEKVRLRINEPRNLEEHILSKVGSEIYEIFFKEYTEKQWGRRCIDLPKETIRRIPIRFLFDENYYNSKYQGIPINGYTDIFYKMTEGIDLSLSTDYFSDSSYFLNAGKKLVFTGCIDDFFEQCFGKLEYRTLDFYEEMYYLEDFQGNAVINFTEKEIPHTRCTEHKHFLGTDDRKITIVSREYPSEYESKYQIPYYPINDKKNEEIATKYKFKSLKYNDIIFGGRLGTYNYCSMDQVICDVLNKAEELI